MSLIQRKDDEIEINVWEVIKLLFSRALVILIVTLAFGLATYAGVSFLVTPQYEASVTMYVNNRTSGDSNTALSQSDLNASAQLVDTYSAIIKNVSVLREVIADAEVDLTAKELKEAVSISAVNGTEVFEITVSNSDPKAAARIANSIASVAPERISDIVEGSSVKVINYAEIPDEISSPSYLKLTLIGMMLGFLLSVAVILVLAFMDTTIRSEESFEQWEYPLLGTIPDLAQANNERAGGYGYARRSGIHKN